jgi:hypothetical protein
LVVPPGLPNFGGQTPDATVTLVAWLVVDALHGDGWVQDIHAQLLPAGSILGLNRRTLKGGKAGVSEAVEDLPTDGGQQAIIRRILHFPAAEKFGSRTGWGNAKSINAHCFFAFGIVDQGLCFAAPTQRVEYGAGSADHGAGRVDRIAALLKDHGAGCGCQRFPCNGKPVPGMQNGLNCALCRKSSDQNDANRQDDRGPGHCG